MGSWDYVQITKEYAPDALQKVITIEEFPHTWAQSSIVRRPVSCFAQPLSFVVKILKINGTVTDDDGIIIVGAHQDRYVICSP